MQAIDCICKKKLHYTLFSPINSLGFIFHYFLYSDLSSFQNAFFVTHNTSNLKQVHLLFQLGQSPVIVTLSVFIVIALRKRIEYYIYLCRCHNYQYGCHELPCVSTAEQNFLRICSKVNFVKTLMMLWGRKNQRGTHARYSCFPGGNGQGFK